MEMGARPMTVYCGLCGKACQDDAEWSQHMADLHWWVAELVKAMRWT